LPFDRLDAPGRVLGDLPTAVWPEARVVVDGVLGEVLGDQIGVAGVERLVVGADAVEVRDDQILTGRQSIWRYPVRR
jgi:hypothetical protein